MCSVSGPISQPSAVNSELPKENPMKSKEGICIRAGFVIAIALTIGSTIAPIVQAQSGADASAPKMEDVYKNIQVFKGLPADQLFITMRFIRASLGVACTYCHAEPV